MCWQVSGHASPPGVGGATSVDVGHNSVRHTLAVFMPGQAVFLQALLLVSGLTMQQQCSEVEEVEVGQQMGHPCGEGGSVTTQPTP